MNDLSQAALKELLEYDPETGRFTWLNPGSPFVKRGSKAGYQRKDGYWVIHLNGLKRYAHRLAWLYVHGTLPSEQIDHINRDRSDNRIANLRDVTHSVNMLNRGRPAPRRKAVVTDQVGVRRRGARWQAYCYVGTRYVHLGTFATPEEAAKARGEAA